MRSGLMSLTVLALGLALSGCEERSGAGSNRHWVQVPPQTLSLMSQKGMSRYDPILIRSYKKESELEIWKRGRDGKYALLKTYPMCRWSGQLGPKVKEGDRQAPEGFYAITPAQMNPNSSFFLSFNMGFPNNFDRAHGRTGSHLMVHGACSSRGCYSMTDEQIAEIYALVRDAHSGGQQAVQMQALPFRMTPENLARHRMDTNMAFWRNLKEGVDHFEVTRQEPKVAVCGKRYVFNATPEGQGRFDAVSACPPMKVDDDIAQAVAQKAREDQAQVAELVAKGTPAIKLVYHDGDQHQSFKQILVSQTGTGDGASSPVVETRSRIAEVSRPEALEAGPQEIVLDANGKPRLQPTAVAARPGNSTAGQTSVARSPANSAPAIAAPAVAPPVAAASVSEMPTSGSGSEDRPFYQRLFSPISGAFSGLTGGSSQPAAIESDIALPSTTPLPPRRQAALGAPASEPRAAASTNLRVAMPAPGTISAGSSPTVSPVH